MNFETIRISSLDESKYLSLVERGHDYEAVSQFINKYLVPSSTQYQSLISRIMSKAGRDLLTTKEINTIGMTITSKTVAFQSSLKKL